MRHVSRVTCHNCSVLVADEDVDLNTADTRGHTPLIIGELQLLALYIIRAMRLQILSVEVKKIFFLKFF